MPQNDGKPGGDTDANKTGGDNGDAAGNAGDKTREQDKGGDDAGDDDEKSGKSGQIVFNSQKELDDMISRRVNRAIKKADDDAKLSKEQLLERERDDALSEVRERDLKDDFVAASGIEHGKAGRFFKMYRDDIETDDKGKPTNMADVIKKVKQDFPELYKKAGGGGDGGGGNGGGGGKPAGSDMNSAIRQMAGRGK